MGKCKTTTRMSDTNMRMRSSVLFSDVTLPEAETARKGHPFFARPGGASVRCSCREAAQGTGSLPRVFQACRTALPEARRHNAPTRGPELPPLLLSPAPSQRGHTSHPARCSLPPSYLAGVRIDGDIMEGGDVAPGGILCKAICVCVWVLGSGPA